MSLHMVTNTERTVAYNKLRQATPDMKLGINNDLNTETKRVGLRLMDPRPSKINQPKSHPSKAMTEQKKEAPPSHNPAPLTTSHDISKALILVGAVILTSLLVWKH